jgi:hypothetical protein
MIREGQGWGFDGGRLFLGNLLAGTRGQDIDLNTMALPEIPGGVHQQTPKGVSSRGLVRLDGRLGHSARRPSVEREAPQGG